MKSSERRERWSRILSEHAQSGETVGVFCQRRQLSAATFYAWRRKLRSAEDSLFVPVAVVSSARIEVDLPGGAKMRVPTDREAIRAVVDVFYEREQNS